MGPNFVYLLDAKLRHHFMPPNSYGYTPPATFGTCRTSMRITADSKAGSTSFAALPPATWQTTWGGFAPSSANMVAAPIQLSGSGWRWAGRLNHMICEKSQIQSAHRYIVQQRMKRPGAWWRAHNAEHMLALRLNRANRQWGSYWQKISKNSRINLPHQFESHPSIRNCRRHRAKASV